MKACMYSVTIGNCFAKDKSLHVCYLTKKHVYLDKRCCPKLNDRTSMYQNFVAFIPKTFTYPLSVTDNNESLPISLIPNRFKVTQGNDISIFLIFFFFFSREFFICRARVRFRLKHILSYCREIVKYSKLHRDRLPSQTAEAILWY